MDKQNTLATMEAAIRQLSHSCQKKQDEIDRLNKQLSQLLKEEDQRVLRQAEVFQQFMKRAARVHNAVDAKLLDVIDSYERQLAELREQLRPTRGSENDAFEEVEVLSVSHEYRSILKSYEKQLREKDQRIKTLEEKLHNVSLDLQGRPKTRDFRHSQQRVRELEKALTHHHISTPGSEKWSGAFRDLRRENENHSRKVADLDQLPLEVCQQYLKEVASQLKVDSVDGLVDEICRQGELVDEMTSYFEFAKDATRLVEMEVNAEISLDEVLAVLKSWRRSVDTRRQQADTDERARALDHIQTLFDVPDLPGLYPRMNQVYTRLSELNNVLRTLRDTLGLPDVATCHMIVDAVDVLKLSNDNHLRGLLQTEDLASVMRKLEEHSSFMPAFKVIVERLMDLLHIHDIHDILPSVRILVHAPPLT